MALRKIVTISITPEQDAFARDRVACGRFSSVSEVMRAGLRLLEQDEADNEVRRRQGQAGLRHNRSTAPST